MQEKITLKQSALVVPTAPSNEEYYGYGMLLCDPYVRADGQSCVDVWWPSTDITTSSVRVINLSHVMPDTQEINHDRDDESDVKPDGDVV